MEVFRTVTVGDLRFLRLLAGSVGSPRDDETNAALQQQNRKHLPRDAIALNGDEDKLTRPISR